MMESIRDFVDSGGWPATVAVLAGALAAAVAAYIITRRVVLPFVHAAVRRTSFKWDDVLLDAPLLHRLSVGVPLVLIWFAVRAIPDLSDTWIDTLERITNSSLVIVGFSVLGALLSDITELYQQTDRSHYKPIRGYVQIARIGLYLFGTVFVAAILVDRSPWFFVSGLGALMAVILLIFRTTILSLVASVQITQNDLIRVGDWIEMQKYDADGTVLDITLASVKVQNFDKTIVSIPTYKFIEEAFRNWRGMQESGGRRIKRCIYIDMSSIRFLTEQEISRFAQFDPLRDYMSAKIDEIRTWNSRLATGDGHVADTRRLTNVGTLRAYLVNYLQRHPDIHKDGMTLLVRQRDPGPHGLPIEIYGFTTDTDWTEYERIQSDIFDHVLAMIPEFGLTVFQSPSGTDVKLAEPNRTAAGV